MMMFEFYFLICFYSSNIISSLVTCLMEKQLGLDSASLIHEWPSPLIPKYEYINLVGFSRGRINKLTVVDYVLKETKLPC